jgi:hypothetical protein
VWCTELPHLLHMLHFFLPCVMCSLYVLLSCGMLASSQHVSWVLRGLLWVAHAMVACGVVARVSCTDLPHLVHLLTFLSLLVHVSPRRVSLPCYGSFVTASELAVAFHLSVAHAMVA